jgi:phospholipase C
VMRLRNPADEPITVEISDNAFKKTPVTQVVDGGKDAAVVLALDASYGWYDYTVKTVGFDQRTRFAGHVETGRSSFSDPLMGGVV